MGLGGWSEQYPSKTGQQKKQMSMLQPQCLQCEDLHSVAKTEVTLKM